MENKKDTQFPEVSKNNDKGSENPLSRAVVGIEADYLILKKIEKIVLALYLITGVFPDREPLRETIRHKSLELFNSTSPLKYRETEIGAYSNSNTRTLFMDIISLISIGNQSGLISSMNYDILKKEIEKVLEIIDRNGKEESKRMSLFSAGFFAVSPITPDFEGVYGSKDKTKGHYIKSLERQDKNLSFKKSNTISRTSQHQESHSSSTIKKIGRRENILDIIRIKKRVTIKDISSIIKDCSEKTIQRELNSLLEKGVISRYGERRWSTYALS